MSLRAAFVASEAVPFAKVGGLADIAGALPTQLHRQGCELSLWLPAYGAVDRDRFKLSEQGRFELGVEHGFDRGDYRLLQWDESPDVAVYFIDAPVYFDRPGIYVDPASGEAYADDGERFLFFSLAVLDALTRQGEAPDLIHCNDHHTGMLPALLARFHRESSPLANAATVYSIHNLSYQGIHARSLLSFVGMDPATIDPDGPFAFFEQLNFMKAGIRLADVISTVSPRYAVEICSGPEYGYSLVEDLNRRQEDLVGILNGIDTEIWSPGSDPHLPANYSVSDADEGKRQNKAALQREAGLTVEPDIPLFGIVSRLVEQKGFDLFEPVMSELMSLPLQLVILGTGQKELEDLFRDFSGRYPDRLALFMKFDEGLAHRIEAGSDFFLMPSRYEPCGLNQMYSLRYGSIPVVRATGGLADTVRDVEADVDEGTGIVFEDYEPEALLAAVRRAIAVYREKEAFSALRRRAMSADFTWARSAGDYLRLYEAALLKGRGEVRKARSILAPMRLSSWK